MKEIIKLSNGGEAVLIKPESPVKRVVLYLHGGGFVYGSKSDLPKILADIFLEKGYAVLAVDYLLTPNTSLKNSLLQLQKSFNYLKETVIQELPFTFCGRSAGSYAMLFLTKKLLENNLQLPEQLIHFYGYNDLKFIAKPRKIADITVTKDMIQSIDQKQLIWDDPLLQRYLLYIYAIQQEKLANFYQVNKENIDEFTIRPEVLAQFPPTFSSASSTDEEIPFKYSKQLKKIIPNSKFVAVYNLEHDFLKQTDDEQVKNVLKKLSDWIK